MNSDLIYRGLNFHIQTEDWGRDNPFVVSRVYQDGAVVKSIKTPYAEILGIRLDDRLHRKPLRLPVDPQDIRRALQEQHQKILDLLVAGQLF